MSRRVRVAIESPYRGDRARNEAFAEVICRFAWERGFNPFAMHLFFTRFLNDDVPSERAGGIECGLAWTEFAEEVWFCLRPDEVMSEGMRLAAERAAARLQAGELKAVRLLTFTQDGRLLSGWDGPLPTPSTSEVRKNRPSPSIV